MKNNKYAKTRETAKAILTDEIAALEVWLMSEICSKMISQNFHT